MVLSPPGPTNNRKQSKCFPKLQMLPAHITISLSHMHAHTHTQIHTNTHAHTCTHTPITKNKGGVHIRQVYQPTTNWKIEQPFTIGSLRNTPKASMHLLWICEIQAIKLQEENQALMNVKTFLFLHLKCNNVSALAYLTCYISTIYKKVLGIQYFFILQRQQSEFSFEIGVSK